MYIYGIKDIRTGKYVYIGQTSNPSKREQIHFTKGYDSSNSMCTNMISSGGREFYKFEIIVECTTQESDDLEDYYINLYNTLVEGWNKQLNSSRAWNSDKFYEGLKRKYGDLPIMLKDNREKGRKKASTQYVDTKSGKLFYGCREVWELLKSEGYSLSYRVVEHLIRENYFSGSNSKKYPELLNRFSKIEK